MNIDCDLLVHRERGGNKCEKMARQSSIKYEEEDQSVYRSLF